MAGCGWLCLLARGSSRDVFNEVCPKVASLGSRGISKHHYSRGGHSRQTVQDEGGMRRPPSGIRCGSESHGFLLYPSVRIGTDGTVRVEGRGQRVEDSS